MFLSKFEESAWIKPVIINTAIVLLTSMALTACGGGASSTSQPPSPPLTYSNSGSVSRLQADDFLYSADGYLAISADFLTDAGYSIAVMPEPARPFQTCAGGHGTAGNTDVSNTSTARVTDTVDIAVTARGAQGPGLVLGDPVNELGFDLPFAAGTTRSCVVLDNGDRKCWRENYYDPLSGEDISFRDGERNLDDDRTAVNGGSE